jgi:hypothetical protein
LAYKVREGRNFVKWEKEALEGVDAIPAHEITKNMVIIWAEKLARKKNSGMVTRKEVEQTRTILSLWGRKQWRNTKYERRGKGG